MLKAVIMAGGEGTRLRPISLGMPKPMVTLMDEPVLGYILALLKKNGITDACVTLRYMPEAVTEYLKTVDFGINITVKIETEPRGTAGGVKNCADFLGGEDFLVISGDCVCDFDLKKLMDFHKLNNAAATLALYEHPEPLEYGLVITHRNGRIAKFIEKPPWEGVVTNKINTGIYILSKTALDEIPPNTQYDFGKDLFPKLLRTNRALYGLSMGGYWCDIGSPEAYLRCGGDILDGKTGISLNAEHTREGVYTLSDIPKGVIINPPVFIGKNVRLKQGCELGPRAVIGSNSTILRGASVADSMVLGASVHEGASVDRAVVCSGAVVGKGASIREGAVIGESCAVGDNAVIGQSVMLWPGRRIPQAAHIKQSVTSGMLDSGPGFSSNGVITGCAGLEISVPFALRLGSALAKYGRVGFGHRGGAAAQITAETIACGVCGTGGNAVRFDCGLPSAVSFAGTCLALPVTVSVTQDGESVEITLFGRNGGVLSHDSQRKLINDISSGTDYKNNFGEIDSINGMYEMYTAAAARYAAAGTGGAAFEAAVTGDGIQNRLLRKTLEAMGIKLSDRLYGVPRFEVSGNGMTLSAADEDGRRLSPERLMLLTAAIEFRRGRREIAAAYEAPAALDALAGRFGGRVYRLGRDGAHAENLYEKLRAMRDGIFAGALICSHLMREGLTLSALAAEMPRFSFVSREMPLNRERSEIMSALSAAASETAAEFSSGIVLKGDKGTIRVTPARDKSALLIKSESTTEEIAQELCADLEKMLKRVDK